MSSTGSLDTNSPEKTSAGVTSGGGGHSSAQTHSGGGSGSEEGGDKAGVAGSQTGGSTAANVSPSSSQFQRLKV